jgi:hypothetical protein
MNKRTIAQTPAPKKDRVYGSDLNKSDSSKDLSRAKLIKFDEKTLEAIENKVREHNEEHPDKKINLSSAKAVVRRGMGAYSKSHRPTITGGNPNSRVAWGLARLNAFTYKIVNGKSKSGKYTQDDDLIEELGFKVVDYKNGGEMKKDIRCVNCGWEWNKKDSELWDMYVCHKCGFDNTTFYTSIPVKNHNKGGKLEATGDCYLVAGRIALEIQNKDIDYIGTPYLVHAEVQHSQRRDIRYGHAFIEDDVNVYDFSNNREIIMPKQLYYFFGDINPKNKKKYRKYTFKEARKKMAISGSYGCWNLDVEYGKGGNVEDNNTAKAKKIADEAQDKISHLECDGATRVLHYLFKEQNVNHVVKKGSVFF